MEAWHLQPVLRLRRHQHSALSLIRDNSHTVTKAQAGAVYIRRRFEAKLLAVPIVIEAFSVMYCERPKGKSKGQQDVSVHQQPLIRTSQATVPHHQSRFLSNQTK